MPQPSANIVDALSGAEICPLCLDHYSAADECTCIVCHAASCLSCAEIIDADGALRCFACRPVLPPRRSSPVDAPVPSALGELGEKALSLPRPIMVPLAARSGESPGAGYALPPLPFPLTTSPQGVRVLRPRPPGSVFIGLPPVPAVLSESLRVLPWHMAGRRRLAQLRQQARARLLPLTQRVEARVRVLHARGTERFRVLHAQGSERARILHARGGERLRVLHTRGGERLRVLHARGSERAHVLCQQALAMLALFSLRGKQLWLSWQARWPAYRARLQTWSGQVASQTRKLGALSARLPRAQRVVRAWSELSRARLTKSRLLGSVRRALRLKAAPARPDPSRPISL